MLRVHLAVAVHAGQRRAREHDHLKGDNGEVAAGEHQFASVPEITGQTGSPV